MVNRSGPPSGDQQPLFTRPDQGPGARSYPTIGTPAGGETRSDSSMKSSSGSAIPRIALIAAAVIGVVVIAVGLQSDRDSDEKSADSTTVTVSPGTTPWASVTGQPATPVVAPTPRPASNVALPVSAPITQPPCDGTGIVVLGSAVVPSNYASEVQRLLNAHPGSSYLRTDHACPSLRQVSDTGTAIYAVYRPAGRTEHDVCAAVRAAGGDAYGKWLDMTTDPNVRLTC